MDNPAIRAAVPTINLMLTPPVIHWSSKVVPNFRNVWRGARLLH